MRIQSAAYFLNFSDSRNLASSVPQEGNADFWNFVLQQFCDVKLRGTIGPGCDFTFAFRGGSWLPFFSAVDYRRYAAECVRLAQQVADPGDKARLLDMAETFLELADKSGVRPSVPPVD
jgi:hypothetical protein